MEWVFIVGFSLLMVVVISIAVSLVFKNRPAAEVRRPQTEGDVDGLIRTLSDTGGSAEARKAATEALGKSKDARAIAPLCAALRDPDKNIRLTAAEALGELKSPQAIKPLEALLSSNDRVLRRIAAKSLGKIGKPALDALMIAFSDGSEEAVRQVAADALAKMGDVVVQPLLNLIVKEKNPDVRLLAIKTLRNYKDAPIFESINVAVMSDSDVNVRMAAVEVMGELKDKRAIEILSSAMKDEASAVRRIAVEVLGRLDSDKSIEAIKEALNDDDPDVRKSAVNSLVKLGKPAVDGLILALKNKNQFVRMEAVRALGNIQSSRAISPLGVVLREDDPAIREAAAHSLGQIGEIAALPYLKEACNEEIKGIKIAAISALGKMKDPSVVDLLVHMLSNYDEEVRQVAAEALDKHNWKPQDKDLGVIYWIARQRWDRCAEIGEPAVQPLCEALLNPDEKVRQGAAATLTKMGPVAVPQLVKLLDDGEKWQLSAAAAHILGLIGNAGKQVVKPLLSALEKPNPAVRQAAAEALGRMGDAQAISALGLLLKDKDAGVRQTAAEALAGIGEPAVRPLLSMVRNESGFTSELVLRALIAIGKPSVQALISALKDSSTEMRRVSARALGEIGDSQAIVPLIKILQDNSWEVRQAAARSLEKMNWQPEKEEDSANFWVALENWERVIPLKDAAIKPLAEAFKSKEPGTRKAAVEAMGMLRDARAISDLTELLIDPVKEVRHAVAQALEASGWIPTPSEAGINYWVAMGLWEQCVAVGAPAVKPLVAIMGDPSVSDRVVNTLIRIGSAAVDTLINALAKTPDRQVRKLAAKALGKIGEVRGINAIVDALEKGDTGACLAAPEALGGLAVARAVDPLIKFLNHEEVEIRRAAAKTLSMLYHEGSLDSKNKQRILSRWRIITQPHTDTTDSAGRHSDEGIGAKI